MRLCDVILVVGERGDVGSLAGQPVLHGEVYVFRLES